MSSKKKDKDADDAPEAEAVCTEQPTYRTNASRPALMRWYRMRGRNSPSPSPTAS